MTVRIEKQIIEQMFADMRRRAPWNIDAPSLWGYFFIGDADKLKAIAESLVPIGYRLVELYEEGDEPSRLHLERVEPHTPETLDARNLELDGMAGRFGVQYDGFDVGAPPAGAEKCRGT